MAKANKRRIGTDVNVLAENLFTDREIPKEAFWNIYNNFQVGSGSYEVIAYYGDGGIGKTTLLKKLALEMEEKIKDGEREYLYYSFEKKPEKEMTLYNISRQLMLCNKGLSCDFFDAAFVRMLTLEGKDISQYENKMKLELSDNKILGTAVDLVGDFSPIPGTGTALRTLLNLVSFSANKFGRKVPREVSESRIIREINYCTESKDIRKKLQEYLVEDLYDYFSERKTPFVFFIDGYENFVDLRKEGIEAPELEADFWLKDSQKGLSSIPNTIWVLAGREKMHWPEDILPNDQTHLMGGLSDIDTDNFLREAGIYNGELREHIYKITEGFPAYLDLCINTYRKIVDDREPQKEDFGKNTVELVNRWLEQMSPEMKKMMGLISVLPNVWTREMAEDTAKRAGYEYCVHYLDEIVVMSMIEKVSDGFKLHKTIRDVLSDYYKDLLSNKVQASSEIEEVLEEADGFRNEALAGVVKWLLNSSSNDYRYEKLNEFSELISQATNACIDEDDFLKVLHIIEEETKDTGEYFYSMEMLEIMVGYAENRLKTPLSIVWTRNIRNYNLYRIGKYNEFHSKSIEAYEYANEMLGEEHRNTLWALNNLATSYSALGEYEKAEELIETCYKIKKRVLGEEHPDTLWALNNLASSYRVLGEYKKAKELQENCYETHKRVLGEEHPDTIKSLNNLANSYSDLDDHKKAKELQENCYETYKRVLGEEHPDTLLSLNNLATSYSDLGEYEKAKELIETCYETYKRVLGEEHPDTLRSLNNLATSYHALGEYEKAKELRETCYEIQKRVLGEEHPDTLMSLNNLTSSYSALGEHKKAKELRETCYVTYRRVLGEEHPDTLMSLNNLAISYHALGEYAKAEVLYETYSEAQKKSAGRRASGHTHVIK